MIRRLMLILVLPFALAPSVSIAADRPNIVFMMSDDQAWNGLSVPMHPELDWSKSAIVETPQLEKLASQGMRFSAAYAPAGVGLLADAHQPENGSQSGGSALDQSRSC